MQNRGNRQATIVHAIPGRVRVRLDPTLRSPDFMRSLVETLSEVKGVHQVQSNPTTGSILLLFDPGVLSLEQLYLAASAADVVIVTPGASSEPPVSEQTTPLARSINSAVGRMDRTVFDFTGGKIDVKTLFPLGLAAAAVRQIATSGGNLAAAPWYVLLWYSFETFTKYNLRKEKNGSETRGSAGEGIH